MRVSMVFSLLIALMLAGVAVFGARSWLAAERATILDSFTNTQAPAEVEDEAPEFTLVVAREPISFGERLLPSKLTEVPWPADFVPEGSFQAVEILVPDDSEESARFAKTQISAGEPILVSKITEPGVLAKLSVILTPGMKAISIRVNDVAGVAGFVLPGDRVDVLLTRNDYNEPLLQGVKVLAIDQIADDRKDQPSVVRTITFEVNTVEAQKLTLGAQVGMLSLALRNLTSTDVEPNRRITLDDLSDLDISDNLLAAAEEEPAVVAPELEIAVEEPVEPVAEEEKVAEVVAPEVNPADERIALLESLLKGMADDLDVRLDSLENKVQAPAPQIVREEVVREVIVERAPIIPETVKVGVIRNGQRVEYKVDVVEQNEEDLQQNATE